MISNGILQDGCEERHDVRFRKRWRCLLRVKHGSGEPFAESPLYPDEPTSSVRPTWPEFRHYFFPVSFLGSSDLLGQLYAGEKIEIARRT